MSSLETVNEIFTLNLVFAGGNSEGTFISPVPHSTEVWNARVCLNECESLIDDCIE